MVVPRALLAEAVGTFVMLLAGGAAILAGFSGPVVALVFGAAVAAMIVLFGPVSGAHFNPAITVGFASAGRFAWNRVAGFLVAQLVGAFAAVLALLAVRPVDAVVAHGRFSSFSACAVEVVATFVLAFVIYLASRRSALQAGLVIGATVALGAWLGGPFSGAAMNPARALAPAVLAGDWRELGLHLVGPLLGGVIGMLAGGAVQPSAPAKAVA